MEPKETNVKSEEKNTTSHDNQNIEPIDVDIVQFINGLDITDHETHMLTGCIAALMTFYATEKAKMTLAAACGCEPTSEEFNNVWNDTKNLIISSPNELYHTLLTLFDLDDSEGETMTCTI